MATHYVSSHYASTHSLSNHYGRPEAVTDEGIKPWRQRRKERDKYYEQILAEDQEVLELLTMFLHVMDD